MTELDQLQRDIKEFIEPGSMAIGTIVEGLEDEYPQRELKIELSSMICEGELEEHPEIQDVYRVSDSVPHKASPVKLT